MLVRLKDQLPVRTEKSFKIIEREGNFNQSQAHGTLLTLKELPQLIQIGLLSALEETTFFKENGHVGFYLGDERTTMNGPYEFDVKGKTLDKMFLQTSAFELSWLDFDKTAIFLGRGKCLKVGSQAFRSIRSALVSN